MENLIEVKNLSKYYEVDNGTLKAVDNISFNIKKGETFGLVGESGCGKSTTGKIILKLEDATAGQVIFEGKDIYKMSQGELKEARKHMQIIFQDPYASLDPRMTVKEIISEPLDIYNIGTKEEREDRVFELLDLVGLSQDHALRYAHEFSGGQRQRIGIARALALKPDFIVCDEPISALDVSIQAQIVNLLKDLQDDLGLTLLFIAHDLSMVKYISNTVAVMYLGNIMEIGEGEEIYANPLHPYTQALLSAIPIADPKVQRARKKMELEGDVVSPINPKPGCRFKDRCPFASEECGKVEIPLRKIKDNHYVACIKVK